MNRRFPYIRRVLRQLGLGGTLAVVPDIPAGRTADLVPGDSPSQLFVDQSGNGITTSDADTADAPTRIAEGVFGLPTLRGDGSNDGLRVVGLAHAGDSHTFSFLCSVQESLPIGSNIFFFEGRGSSRLACELRASAGASGTYGVFNGATHRSGFGFLPASGDGATDEVITAGDHLVTYVLNDDTSELLVFRGRELVGVTTYAGQPFENTDSMAVFAQYNGTSGECQIDIARVQTWGRALSYTERSDFFDAMQDAVPGSAPRLTRVMMAGDSLVQGVGATSGSGLVNITRDLLEAGDGTWRMVGDQGTAPDAHFGRSGDTIADQASVGAGIFTRLGVGTDYRPDVVHLMIGTNDCEDNSGADYDATDTIAALEALASGIIVAEPGVRLVLATPPPISPAASSAYDQARANLADLVPKIRTFAASRSIPLADMYAATWVAGDYDDNVHWNDTGYAKAAAISAPAIRVASALSTTVQSAPVLSAFFLGHSLLGFEVPNVVQRFADVTVDVTLNRDVGIGVGASLEYQWDNPATTGGDNPSTFLQAGPYDVLVITEAVPIENQLSGADSVTNALNFANLALAENAAVQVYLYETWEDRTVTDGWEVSVNERRTYYEQIKSGFDASFTGADLRIIPGGQAVRTLSDAVTAGDVRDITDPDDLFVVEGGADIHPTELLIYFLGCVHFAVLYQRTPVGLPSSLLDRFGTAYASVPTANMAADMQAIAWAAVQAEPYSGVDAVVGIPTFDSMSPASMSVDADASGNVLVTFSEPMNAGTIYGDTLRLTAAGSLVASTITYAGSVATINPTSDLAGDTLYTVTATTGIQDASGNNMTANRSLSFTTESVVLAPEFNTSSPVADAVGAARFAGITVYFFQDIDGTTVDDTTFLVTLTSDDSDVPGTLSVSGGAISFSPTSPLAASAEHRVQLTSGVEGVAPRGPIVPLDFTFTTSA
jgi:lysophospholipase L1-like esterase